MLSAVKRAERGDALILRFYNPAPEAVQASVTLFRPIQTAQLVNLNDEPQADLPVDAQGRVSLEVGGKQVCTLAVRV